MGKRRGVTYLWVNDEETDGLLVVVVAAVVVSVVVSVHGVLPLLLGELQREMNVHTVSGGGGGWLEDRMSDKG